jgi:hypothetical protein
MSFAFSPMPVVSVPVLGQPDQVTRRGLKVDAFDHVRDVLRGWHGRLRSDIPITI